MQEWLSAKNGWCISCRMRSSGPSTVPICWYHAGREERLLLHQHASSSARPSACQPLHCLCCRDPGAHHAPSRGGCPCGCCAWHRSSPKGFGASTDEVLRCSGPCGWAGCGQGGFPTHRAMCCPVSRSVSELLSQISLLCCIQCQVRELMVSSSGAQVAVSRTVSTVPSCQSVREPQAGEELGQRDPCCPA